MPRQLAVFWRQLRADALDHCWEKVDQRHDIFHNRARCNALALNQQRHANWALIPVIHNKTWKVARVICLGSIKSFEAGAWL